MSRTQSQGIDYFPCAVDFFSDKKVKILKARYGADGVEIYLYLLCQVYREGYYTRVDEDFLYMLSDDLSMSPEKVQLVLKFLLERSMFDEQLFLSDNVLTSAGIQERWQKAVSTRAAKTPMKVDAYWLLSKAETQPFIKVAHFADCSEKKADTSEKNIDSSEKNDTKESKVEESIVIPPISPQEGEARGEAKERFLNAYPKLKACKRYDDSGLDYDILLDRFARSEHLRKTYSMKWLCDNYDLIASGVFDDAEPASNQSEAGASANLRGERERHYAKLQQKAITKAENIRALARRDEAFRNAEAVIKQGEIELARAEIFAPDTVAEINARLARAKEMRIEALTRLKLSDMDLEPAFKCKKCSDTGFLPDGRMCDCYEKNNGEKL